ALSSASLASEPKPLTWRTWDAGLREASGAKRPILVDVYTNWCGWCKRMDRDVYSRADVQDYLSRRFVLIKLNAEAPDAAAYEGPVYTSRSLAARFRVSGFRPPSSSGPAVSTWRMSPGTSPPSASCCSSTTSATGTWTAAC